MILHILQDYFHWRRNYFPSDEILVTQSLRRESMAGTTNCPSRSPRCSPDFGAIFRCTVPATTRT